MPSPHPLPRVTSTLVFLCLAAWSTAPLAAQNTAKPTTKPPATAKPPSTAKPSTPRRPAAPAAAKPAAPQAQAAPTPPPPQDVRFKTVYTAGDQRTESTTYLKGERERFEFADSVLIKQHDQKRTLQISTAAKTYVIIPDGPAAVPSASPAATKPPGVINVTTAIADSGERKQAFGREARRVKITIDSQPAAGACDQTKQRIETDGWYIDAPQVVAGRASHTEATAPPAGGCRDEIKATQTGDPKVLGFPIGYSTTITGADGKPSVVAMEISEFDATTLDAALFDAPAGFAPAATPMEFAKAISDANERSLAAASSAAAATAVAKAPGVIRIGVPELTNKTAQAVDTRDLRDRLVASLQALHVEVTPLAAAPQPQLLQQATTQGLDYVLVAEVSELKVNKPGGLGGAMRMAGRVTGGLAGAAANAAAPRQNTEAAVAVKLLQPDGKARLSTTAKGKDGSGFSLQTGLSVAKFAGSAYMSMYTGRAMMKAFSTMRAGNLNGMGMLNSPELMQMQARAMGASPGAGMWMGVDPTAQAASYVVQQALNAAAPPAVDGAGQPPPSYDESLGEAIDNTAKSVAESLKKGKK